MYLLPSDQGSLPDQSYRRPERPRRSGRELSLDDLEDRAEAPTGPGLPVRRHPSLQDTRDAPSGLRLPEGDVSATIALVAGLVLVGAHRALFAEAHL